MASDFSGINKFFSTDPEELIALKRRVMEDVLPPMGTADMIYCVGGTADTQDQDLIVGAWLWEQGYAGTVGVLGASAKSGYPGFEFCYDLLVARGVDKAAIFSVDIFPEDRDKMSTYTEGKALLFHAGRERWKTIIVCAPFFHQIRASSTYSSLLNQQHPELWIFNQPGAPGNMKARVKHSQGIVEGDLFELLISEFGRLYRYHDKGDIRSCRELLDYYDRRDREFA